MTPLDWRRLREEWNIPDRVSVRTVTRILNAAALGAGRPIKRRKLTQRHKQVYLDWPRERLNWNIRSWRRIYGSGESKFMLIILMAYFACGAFGRTAYEQRRIQTAAFGGGSVTVWA